MADDKEIKVEVKDGEQETADELVEKEKAKMPEEDSEQSGAPEVPVEAAAEDADSEAEEADENEQLQAKIDELQDRLLRHQAEFENYRRRMSRQIDDMAQAGTDRLLLDLLEVVDSFDRALQHSHEASEVDALRQGMELIHGQLKNLLKKYDVEPIEALGHEFDPGLHEALMQVPSEEYDEGVVAVEMSKGYRRGDRVLRHSRVGVSTGLSEEE